MNTSEAESNLVAAMKRLEQATDKIIKTSGYGDDAKKMRLLTELIKEQIRNENIMSAAGKAR
jgi:hypothetical protein